jgi:putative ATP-dependent endonuclease of OLD family
VYGETDITTASNITILEGTDFEGYLLDGEFQGEVEKAILNQLS